MATRKREAFTSQINTLDAQVQTLDEQIAMTQKEMQDEWSEQRQPLMAESQVVF